jgi:hypothetical protein
MATAIIFMQWDSYVGASNESPFFDLDLAVRVRLPGLPTKGKGLIMRA